MKLIEDWKKYLLGAWSVRLSAIGSALLSLFAWWPDTALTIWSTMPAELKAVLPEQAVFLIPLGCFAASIVARVIKQEKLTTGGDDGDKQ